MNMDSQQTTNSGDRTHGNEPTTVTRNTFPIGRVALVAVLVACAVVDFATPHTIDTDLYTLALTGATPEPAHGANAAPGLRSSRVTEYELPALFISEARAHDGDTTTGKAVPPAPSAAEIYFPARFTNQGKSDDGNVMTYEHD
jgi:hypothetical protein